eukprot:CAMPEP_0194203132 /NCGR_PEP_ID=MMETSP0156-20130528/2999_1 /TAXON_ID=33649 /ORGANISM="Thalassionema nitzschioides, Strain L26-B" /LENGTH=60 /DNA_ID=CAMNT_0038928823 /DNA_START=70 /DNA_END=249 /DNA_ORIENTATION=+
MKVFGKVLLLANLFAVANSQCSVCGEGLEVTISDAIFAFPGEPTRTCGELEDEGEQGLLS